MVIELLHLFNRTVFGWSFFDGLECIDVASCQPLLTLDDISLRRGIYKCPVLAFHVFEQGPCFLDLLSATCHCCRVHFEREIRAFGCWRTLASPRARLCLAEVMHVGLVALLSIAVVVESASHLLVHLLRRLAR